MKAHTLALTAALLTLSACGDGGAVGLEESRLNVLPTSCSDPAPLLGTPDSRVADSYIVVFDDSTDSAARTAELEEKYGFTAQYVYEHALEGFAAVLSAETVAAIRCEADVKYIEHDAVVSID